jgi:hypothetical protein
MKDIFGREVEVGHFVAAGMNLNQSSVLRIGEVVKISETLDWQKKPTGRQSVRIKWRNNGPSEWSWDVKDSNIIYDPTYSYAKVVILDPAFVEQFPADIKR